MKSIIQELQAGAADENQVVSDLLRKAKIVAVKLELPEFLDWINSELNGYFGKDRKSIPPYRFIVGEPKAWNPYHGWIPVMFSGDSNAQKMISETYIIQPVGELVDLYNSGKNDLQIPYPPQVQLTLCNAFGFQTKYTLVTNRTTIVGILDAVRNIILDWSLKLEKEGILGEGLSFSRQEQEKAHEPTTIVKVGKIENFVGNLGTMTDQASISITQINKESISQVRNLADQIKKHINEISLSRSDKTTVERNIQELETEITKKNPESSRISKLLGSVKRVMEGASGNIIAQGIIASIDKLI